MDSVRGRIVSVSGRSARVDVDSSQACTRCAAGNGCGAGLFTGQSQANEIEVELPADTDFQPGDTVELSISESRLLYASILAYGLPLAGMVMLTFLGRLFMQALGDAMGIVLALTGLMGGFLVGRRQLRKESCLRQFVPLVTSRHDVEVR